MVVQPIKLSPTGEGGLPQGPQPPKPSETPASQPDVTVFIADTVSAGEALAVGAAGAKAVATSGKGKSQSVTGKVEILNKDDGGRYLSIRVPVPNFGAAHTGEYLFIHFDPEANNKIITCYRDAYGDGPSTKRLSVQEIIKKDGNPANPDNRVSVKKLADEKFLINVFDAEQNKAYKINLDGLSATVEVRSDVKSSAKAEAAPVDPVTGAGLDPAEPIWLLAGGYGKAAEAVSSDAGQIDIDPGHVSPMLLMAGGYGKAAEAAFAESPLGPAHAPNQSKKPEPTANAEVQQLRAENQALKDQVAQLHEQLKKLQDSIDQLTQKIAGGQAEQGQPQQAPSNAVNPEIYQFTLDRWRSFARMEAARPDADPFLAKQSPSYFDKMTMDDVDMLVSYDALPRTLDANGFSAFKILKEHRLQAHTQQAAQSDPRNAVNWKGAGWGALGGKLFDMLPLIIMMSMGGGGGGMGMMLPLLMMGGMGGGMATPLGALAGAFLPQNPQSPQNEKQPDKAYTVKFPSAEPAPAAGTSAAA